MAKSIQQCAECYVLTAKWYRCFECGSFSCTDCECLCRERPLTSPASVHTDTK